MTRFLKRQWPLLGMGALVAVAGFYLVNANREMMRAPLFGAVMPEGALNLTDIHYTHDDPDEGLKWLLDAAEVTFSEDKRSIYFKGFRLTLKPENRAALELKGNRGDYSRDSEEIELWGNLVGTSERGYTITTEHVRINERKGTLQTNGTVEIIGPFFSVTGQGLFADVEKRRLKVLSNVTMRIDRKSLNP